MADRSGADPSRRIVELTAEETHPLRRIVLRADTPTKEVSFAEDTWPGAVHLGLVEDDELIGTSSWIPRPWTDEPEAPAVQLRGMATLHRAQGTGVGAELLRAGIARARDDGATLVWANARDAALAFYERNGFTKIGVGFVDATTQLPHHVVVHRL
jgi:GNAT superfamily N-acetyltransferase